MQTPEQLSAESVRATEMLAGLAVARVERHRDSELMIEFSDGTRLFVDVTANGLELSITGHSE